MGQNELTQMLAYVKAQRSGLTGQLDPDSVTDDEGFSPSAIAPPATGLGKDEPEVALATNNPRKELETYQSANYPPKVIAIDLEAMKVVGSHGKFDLEDDERKQIIAIAIRSMQRSYEKILQTLVESAGLAQTTEDVESRPETEESSASSTPKKKGRSPN